MPGRVNRQTKSLDALEAGFVQRHHSILEAVLLALAIFAVVVVLRIAITQQQQEFDSRILQLEFAHSVANGRPHTRTAMRFDGRNAPLDTRIIALIKFLDYKALDL